MRNLLSAMKVAAAVIGTFVLAGAALTFLCWGAFSLGEFLLGHGWGIPFATTTIMYCVLVAAFYETGDMW